MLVKVFIKRQIAEGKCDEAFALLKALRFAAMEQEGYVSGETLIRAGDPHKIMVISTWQGLENWQKWKESAKRKELEAQLEALHTEPVLYEPYVFSKYRLSVEKGFPDSI